jgi:hypothetical protein
MSESTRRRFLLTAGAGAAVAAAATAGIAGREDEANAVGAAGGANARLEVDGPLVAYVSDAKSGRVSVMVGESEVVVTDHDLVARLSSARNRG